MKKVDRTKDGIDRKAEKTAEDVMSGWNETFKINEKVTKRELSDKESEEILSRIEMNPLFEERFQPISESQLDKLEDNIKRNGFKHAIEYVLYNNKTYIIDGHNRFKVYKRGNIKQTPKFELVENLEDITEIFEYMDSVQVDTRRNLSNVEKSFHIGRKYNELLRTQEGIPKKERIDSKQIIMDRFEETKSYVGRSHTLYFAVEYLLQNIKTQKIARNLLVYGTRQDITLEELRQITKPFVDSISTEVNDVKNLRILLKNFQGKGKDEKSYSPIKPSAGIKRKINTVLSHSEKEIGDDAKIYLEKKIADIRKLIKELQKEGVNTNS